MFELCDEIGNPSNSVRICDHLIEKLQAPAFEWKRILKTMNVVEFLLKNAPLNGLGKLQMVGNPVIQKLSSFSYQEGTIDRGKQIRDKAFLLLDLFNNQHKLEMERNVAM